MMEMIIDKKSDFGLTETQDITFATADGHTSELSTVVTRQAFEQAYIKFMEQADQNALTKKSNGSRTPYGFSIIPECDGAKFLQHFGHGAPSATPYMNWWVVSIYYIVSNGNIVVGIEEDRYPLLNDIRIKPILSESIGHKKTPISVFYSANKKNVNYESLYEIFISVCEEVMRLGVVDSTGSLSDRNNSASKLPKDKGNAIKHRTSRNITQRLRYQVLARDNYKCCACGASPAKDPAVELQVDHIVPWSKGGETVLDNLQTLCSKCNLGKSDLVLEKTDLLS